MSNETDYDVLIVGAGPTGMSAALALHDYGYKIKIIDKYEKGLSFSRAILVNSQTLNLLKPYGVSDKIMQIGFPFSSITINGPSGVIIDGRVDFENNSAVHPTSLPQLDTERCFQEALAQREITITRPCILKSFEQYDNHVEAFFEDNAKYQPIRAKYLLGADGFHSTVRNQLGIYYNQSADSLMMYSQDADIDWSNNSDVTIWILNTGAVLAFKIGNNKVRFAATNKESFEALEMTNRIQKTTWESDFAVYFAQVSRYGDRRVWLAGDAAHVHSPVGGRGMNMGIADGIRYARAVAENDFAGYQRDRHAVSESWVKKNRLFTEIMSDKSLKGLVSRALVRQLFSLVGIISGQSAAKKIFNAIAVG